MPSLASVWLLGAVLAVTVTWPAHAQLRIHEILASNRNGLQDERGDRPDWIELFNPSSNSVPLIGWSLSDDPKRPTRWTFRNGQIAPGAYQLVFASGEDRQPASLTPRDPDSVPGLVLRLRASDVDPLDASQVRGTGSDRWVTQWRDVSRRTGDARMTDPARQPRWMLSQNRATLRFDGVDDLLLLPRPPATNTFTVLVVVRPTARHEIDEEGTAGVTGTTGQHWLFGAAHGGDAGAGAGLSLGTNGAAIYEHGSAYMPARCVSTRALGDRWTVVAMVYSNRIPTLTLDGLIVRTATEPSLRNPVTAPVEIGSGAYGAFAGEVSEVIAYNRSLSPEERESIEASLAQTYALRLDRTYHAAFQLDADGESLQLTQPNGTVADRVTFDAMPVDVSLGREEASPETFAYFVEPTPAAPNRGPTAHRRLTAPAFSHAPGFHTNAFELRLESGSPDPTVQLRYTLDGSEPTAQSTLYAGPLPITARANAPNQYSAIPTAPGWNPPAGLVFKGTVVRARAFAPDALPSDTSTATFFVHAKGRARYALPVVALSTAPKNLFDPDLGIYVPGNAEGGNYAQAGDAWERPVHVEFFETNGTRVLSQPAGLRIHGNTSFNFPLKALRLHARNQGGTSPFRARIFPDRTDTAYERLLLRPSGHDYNLTLMRDGLMQGLVRDLAVDLQSYRPAILFIDGEYWGIHNLQEAFEKRFFSRHHPEVDPEALDYLEGYPPGTFAYEGDATDFNLLFQSLASLPLESETGFAQVQRQISTDSYRDYKLAEIFYYRWDIGNHRLWRPHTADGRWRWILFDCDVGFGGFWSEANPWSFNMLRAVLEPTGSLHGHNNETTTHLLRQCLRNDGFRRGFIDRAADLLNTTFATPRVIGSIDRMAAEISPSIVEHISRWREPASFFDWTRHVEALRTFARQRPAHVRQHLRQTFQLGAELALRLTPPTPGAGTLSVNTLDPLVFERTDTPWTGTYFRGHRIQLQARANPGWRFAGWTGLPGFTNSTLTVTLSQDFDTAAIFIPDIALSLHLAPGPDVSVWSATLHGPANATVSLESCLDLANWRETRQVELGGSGQAQILLAREPIESRFYRLRWDPPATNR